MVVDLTAAKETEVNIYYTHRYKVDRQENLFKTKKKLKQAFCNSMPIELDLCQII